MDPEESSNRALDAGRLSSFINAIRDRDSKLGEELRAKRAAPPQTAFESLGGGHFALETIVLRTGRPVLAISHDEPRLKFTDAESQIWRDRLEKARPALLPAIRAVGRIELNNNPRFDWVGTGWLVDDNVVVTNRHVALEFGRARGEGFVFRAGRDTINMSAAIDFLEEVDNAEQRTFQIAKILHIEDDDGPDLAFLWVEGDLLAPKIALATKAPQSQQLVAVIGYPARDSRIPDQPLMGRIFGDVYDKKRLAPGQIIASAQGEFEHDCSTLGGNSGSVVLDLATGEAVGIHFAGRFLEANFAVPAPLITERLEAVRSGTARSKPASKRPTSADAALTLTQAPAAITAKAPETISCTIPINITVSIGSAQSSGVAAIVTAPSTPDDRDVAVTEGRPEEYRGREGYKDNFLGDDKIAELPKVVREAEQVVKFEFEGKSESVLRYQHFSVVMNRQRRMCFYSAVNINGKLSRKAARSGWRTDGRIGQDLQIMFECYGNPPKFSRGHMTRREDPVWGAPDEALQGNSDSMHVTNTTPQMQSFNAPIWLGLEDYALQHARQDKMRISVFTGPLLKSDDPVRFGVKIPRSFWKIIAFIHDQTGELTATGYVASQDEQLQEFVFGDYDTWQRPLEWIEDNAGVSFGDLTKHDPLSRGVEALDAPINDFEQIQFKG
jgi:endonuclease G